MRNWAYLLSVGLLTASPVWSAVKPQETDARQVAIEERLDRIERLMKGQALVDMSLTLESLQQEVQKLRGDIELLSHSLENLKSRQRDLYLDIDRRLQKVETGGANTSSRRPSGSTPPVAGVDDRVTTIPGNGNTSEIVQEEARSLSSLDSGGGREADEQAAYRHAFKNLKDGRYDQAITDFKTFLSAYPNGRFADNAQYWLGEANYVQRRFNIAQEEFQKVVDLYPNSSKLPDALLKLGYSWYELSEWQKAKEVLDGLRAKFPNSTAAQLGARRLQKMSAENRY